MSPLGPGAWGGTGTGTMGRLPVPDEMQGTRRQVAGTEATLRSWASASSQLQSVSATGTAVPPARPLIILRVRVFVMLQVMTRMIVPLSSLRVRLRVGLVSHCQWHDSDLDSECVRLRHGVTRIIHH